jgi:glycosyltransferase involved in cell wall biosynthesis
MSSRPLTVCFNAGPWLPIPPVGYGGIENVLATLIPPLRAEGVRVILVAAGGSTLEVDELVTPYVEPQFAQVTAPYNAAMGVTNHHVHAIVKLLRERAGEIDLVHDHLEVVGPSVLGAMGNGAPPILQTLHWDLAKHPDFYGSFDGFGRVFFNALSELQLDNAPDNLRRQTLAIISLAVPVDEFPFVPTKSDAFLHLSRIFRAKGQHTAGRMCRERGLRLDLAGPVAFCTTAEELEAELADPLSTLHGRPDVKYWLDDVEPEVDGEIVRWIGALAGQPKLDALASARALLMPITWDEPGATVVVEALACGTPVIGMRRGAIPMLIDHGVTGFIADTEEEFASYLDRVDEIDPAACRRAAAERFDSPIMARRYIDLYRDIVQRTGGRP